MNTLVPNEGYDVSWTRMDGRDFHSYTPQETNQETHPLLADGVQEFPWLSRCASVQVLANTSTTKPVLLADNYRNLLILQNSSTIVTGSGDTAPTLFVNFDQIANPPPGATAYALALAPGVGIVLDTRVPLNSLYVAYAGAVGTPTIISTVTYGRTPNSPPLSPQAILTIASQHPSATRIVNAFGPSRGY